MENVKEKIGKAVNPNAMAEIKIPIIINRILTLEAQVPGIIIKSVDTITTFKSNGRHIEIENIYFEGFVNELNDLINKYKS